MRQGRLILQGAAITALIVIAVVYAGAILTHISYAAGGSDSSGYLNEARLIAAGRTGVTIDPVATLKLEPRYISVFTPIGFTWGPPNTLIIGPGYPPGLPAHLALAAKVAGWRVAPFLISPLAAFGCGILIFAIALELGLSRVLALAASAMLLFLPQLVAHALQPVSDVLATFWSLLAVWLVLRARRTPERLTLPVFAGLAFGIGVAVRPTNLILIIPLAIAARMRIRALVTLGLSAVPIGVALLLWQNAAYGNPLRTGYGNPGNLLSFASFGDCARIFVHWMSTISTLLVFPGGLLVMFHRGVDRWTRALLPVWFAVYFLMYCLWAPYADWWSARFLLPGTAGLILGTLLIVQSLWFAGGDRQWLRMSARAIVIVIVAYLVWNPARLSLQWQALNASEMTYPRAVRWAERQIPANARIISGTLSGAFFYYTNQFSMRPDQLDDAEFRTLRNAAGPSTLWYAVLDGNELSEVKKRFTGTWTVVNTYGGLTLLRFDS